MARGQFIADTSSDTPPLCWTKRPNTQSQCPPAWETKKSLQLILRHSLGDIHFLRLFFFKDFSRVSTCLQGEYPALKSPPTLLGHHAAWPEGLRRACASTPNAENHLSCGELGMRVAFCCLTALLWAIRQRTSLHPCVIQMIRCCSRSSMDQ